MRIASKCLLFTFLLCCYVTIVFLKLEKQVDFIENVDNFVNSSSTETTSSSKDPSTKADMVYAEEQEQSKEETSGEATSTHPTYLVILKSPRSGSTFLNTVLSANPSIHNMFEPPIVKARKHFESCKTKNYESNITTAPWACSVSFNDYLDEKRYDDINKLISDYRATVVIQLRSNVVEKAISANKLWGELRRQKKGTQIITPQIARSIRHGSIRGQNTIRAFVNAEKFLPSSEPPIWVWYEDLVRQCNDMVGKIYDALRLPVHESVEKKCSEVGFREGSYNDALVEELKKEPSLVPMIDAYKFNMEVDTQAIYDKLKDETANATEVELGHWR